MLDFSCTECRISSPGMLAFGVGFASPESCQSLPVCCVGREEDNLIVKLLHYVKCCSVHDVTVRFLLRLRKGFEICPHDLEWKKLCGGKSGILALSLSFTFEAIDKRCPFQEGRGLTQIAAIVREFAWILYCKSAR